jgi:hypothetical protein
LIDRREHSSLLDVLSFRAADCDTDHYLVVAKVGETLAVSTQITQRFHLERINLRKLKNVKRSIVLKSQKLSHLSKI